MSLLDFGDASPIPTDSGSGGVAESRIQTGSTTIAPGVSTGSITVGVPVRSVAVGVALVASVGLAAWFST